MTAQELKNSILQLAIQGKLVPQDPNDEPASVLLEKIKIERDKLIKENKIKKGKYSEIYKDETDNHYYEKFEDETINDITEEIPFDIPQNWSWVRLNNVADIYNGNSISEDVKKKKYSNLQDGFNFIATKDVGFNNKITYENGIKIPFNEEKFKIAYKNTTIMCIEGGSAGRKIAFTNQDICFGNKLATFNTIGINGKYLYYFLQSPYLFDYFKSNMTGIIGGVSINKMKQFLIAIPNIKEQNRIVDKIETILPHIEGYNVKYNKLEKLNNSYKEELKKSILQYAIQGKLIKQNPDDEPASVLIDKILQEKREMMARKEIKQENLSIIYKNSTDNQFYEKFDDGKIVNINEEIPFDIPNNWCWCRLNNIVNKEIKRGKSPKYSAKSTIKVFAQKCNQKNGFISLENAKFLDESTIKKYDETDFIKNDDIVINSTGHGTLGRIGIIKNEIIKKDRIVADSHITLIRLMPMCNTIYIYNFLKYSQNYLESMATGSTNQTELSPNIIKKLLIPISPIDEQYLIVTKLENIFNNLADE